MKSRFILLLGGVMFALLPGCEDSPKSSRGFRLPDGDAAKGKEAFLALQCHKCHKVEGVELPAPISFNLTLGGETVRVRTYGQLVTSIINPSHVVSAQYQKELTDAKESPMPKFNHVMTVEQMIDLVAFLQAHYHLAEPVFEPTAP
jgi:L-cysteine S-thiosulfotransferase